MKKFYLSAAGRIRRGVPCTRRSQSCITLIILFFISISSYATHMAGGELTYRWLGGTTYEFTAKFYRDCAGVAAPTSLVLNYSSSTCHIANKSATLNLINGTGNEITLPCPSAHTTCSGGTSPGFQEWVYMDTVDIKKNCTDWVFNFSSCCRNTSITTIQNPGADNMYVEATLDNLNFPSASSPTFTNPPILSFCVNQFVPGYNRGTVDPNGDSLVYSLICPRTDASTCVAYNAPYSATNPVSSSTALSLNSVTGSLTMTPNIQQIGVATILVEKWHKAAPSQPAAKIGSVITDMEILVVNCADNAPTASGINGTNVFTDTVCAGSNVCFNITSNDVDNLQSVTMSWNSGISGATFIITPGQYPVGQFCWTPTASDASSTTHQFTVTVTDDACPTNESNIYTYTILVPHDTVQITAPQIACFGNTGSATATASGGISPYTYVWSPSAQTTSTATGLTAGTSYTVTATDSKGCTSKNKVVITTSPAIVASLSDSTEVSCNGGANGTATVSASGGAGGFTHHWSNGETTNPATGLSAGTYTDTVKDANSCIKLVSVTIKQPAVLAATITTQQNVSCKGLANGSLTVTVSGGTRPYSYAWAPVTGTDSTITGLSAGSYTVTVTDNKGCTTTISDSIVQPGTTVPHISSVAFTGGTNIRCNGDSSGSILIDSVSGGTAPFTYLWEPGGATTSSVSGLKANTYTLTVTDANFCTFDTTITLTQPQPLIISFPDFSVFFGGSNVSCNLASDGYINPSVTGGTTPYTFLWSNSATTDSISGLTAGTYTLTVTDTNSCVAMDTITLHAPPPLKAFITRHKNAGCKFEASGSITDSVAGGTPPYSHFWSNDSTTSTINKLVAGIYSDTISDANGCQVILTDTITEPALVSPLITAAVVNGNFNIACSGDTSGSVWIDTVFGGTKPFTFTWTWFTNGIKHTVTTDTAHFVPAGQLEVLITDSAGCSKDTSITLTEPEPLTPDVPIITNVNCNGDSTGIIQLSIFGGVRPYTYMWSPNISTDSIATGLKAGVYSTVITDANGCQLTMVDSTTQLPPLHAYLSAVTTNGGWNISCNGVFDGSINIDSVTSGYTIATYSWAGPGGYTSGSPNISGLGAGTYTLTITDVNNCTNKTGDTITLHEPPALADTLSSVLQPFGGKNISCYGRTDGSIINNISGGTPLYTYLWDTGDTTKDILGTDSAGVHFVTITDANGCTITDSTTLTQPDSINLNASFTKLILCHGDTGCILLAPFGGTPGLSGYTFSWNTSPLETLTPTLCDTAGTYRVTVTDTLGCQVLRDFTLSQPTALNLDSVVKSNFNGSGISCNGDTTSGFIHVFVSGGSPPLNHSWSNGYTVDGNLDNVGAGIYTDTVRDNNGCMLLVTDTLSEPPVLTATLTDSVYAGGFNITCVGNNGFIAVNTGGGTPPYTYSWSPNVSTTSTASGLTAQTYTITISDANNCSVTDTTTLHQSNPFNVTDSLSNYNGRGVTCNGVANGSIKVFITGGASPYTNVWSNGDTGVFIINLPAGIYTDTITDANGCRTFLTDSIVQAPTLSISVTDSVYNGSGVKCNGDANGFIQINVSGGTGPFNYAWSPSVSTTSSASNLVAGKYSYTVTDVNGCTASDSTTLTAPPPLTDVVTDSLHSGFNVTCVGNDGFITVTASGGTTPYSYSWSPNVSTTSTASGLTAQTYTITITDANGCSVTDTTTLHQSNPFNVTDSLSDYNGRGVTCNGVANGSIKVFITGGAPPYTNIWSNSDTGVFIINLPAGIYTDTITDANGCRTFLTDSIIQAPTLSISVTDSVYNGSGVKCNGDANGFIQINVSGGTGPFNYTWSPSVSTTSSASNLVAGKYSYTVTDVNGCTASDSTTLTAPPPLTDVVTDSLHSGFNVTCVGNDGFITVTASGGTTPYSYSWSPNVSTTSTASALTAQTYTITITDANGCSVTDTTTLHQSTTFNVTDSLSDYNGRGVTCNGVANGSIKVFITGGAPPYTNTWSNSDTGVFITNLPAGIYTDTITDANGCRTFLTDSIIQAPTLSLSATDSVYNGSGVKCNGDANGFIQINVSGGTGPFNYTWSPSVSTTSSASNLVAGKYSYTVTDVNGCTASDSTTLTAPPPLTDVVTDSLHSGFNVTCVGNDGFITVTASGGTTPYSYSWSPNVSTTSTASGLTAQTYTITITDANNCSVTDTTTLHQSVPFNISDSTSDFNGQGITCNGATNGLIKVFPSGGAPPYTHLWSNGATTSVIVNLGAGIYTDTISDANGCRTFFTDTIIGPQVVNLSVIDSSYGGFGVKCNGDANGYIQINVSGGTAPFIYVWSAGGSTTSSASNLVAGKYSYTVTDVNGCSASDSLTLTQKPPSIATAGQSGQVCGDSATLHANSPQVGYTGTWSLVSGSGTFSDPNDSAASVTGLTFGSNTFQWLVSDGVCTARATVTIDAFEAVTAAGATNDSVCPDKLSDAMLRATEPKVGAGLWVSIDAAMADHPLDDSTTVSGLVAGDNRFLWTVTNGVCVASDTVVVHVRSSSEIDCNPLVELPTGFSPNGDGHNDDYEVKGIDGYPLNTLKVFNRWGNEVFSTDNYVNFTTSSRTWYGQNKSGDPLPEGTYFVILVINGSNPHSPLHSYVELRRN